MKKVEIIEGVAAMYNNKFWGFQHGDAQYTHNDFGEFDKANISDPRYCIIPTDMTYDPRNSLGRNIDYEKLKMAKLVKVKKTITTEFEIL